MNKRLLLLLHTLSLLCLVPGLILNILKIDISANFFFDINLFNEKRSIFGTLQNLWGASNYLPFTLILLFGIIVPLIKSGIIFYILLSRKVAAIWLYRVSAISKWAMADVFAISIFIAFLGAGSMRNTRASLEPGFYYFTLYVLLSAIVVWVMANVKILPAPTLPMNKF
ncbi:MAG: paraquat-inducible protein A [Ferruginibacter sp.]